VTKKILRVDQGQASWEEVAPADHPW